MLSDYEYSHKSYLDNRILLQVLNEKVRKANMAFLVNFEKISLDDAIERKRLMDLVEKDWKKVNEILSAIRSICLPSYPSFNSSSPEYIVVEDGLYFKILEDSLDIVRK